MYMKIVKVKSKPEKTIFWVVAKTDDHDYSLEVSFVKLPSFNKIAKKLNKKIEHYPEISVFDVRLYKGNDNDGWVKLNF